MTHLLLARLKDLHCSKVDLAISHSLEAYLEYWALLHLILGQYVYTTRLATTIVSRESMLIVLFDM